MMVSPTALKANEEAGDLGQKWIQRNSVGTGPYKLAEVKPNERQVYTRFDPYWRGWTKGQAARVEYIVQLDPAAARLMLERGDVDMTAIYSNDAIEPLRANPQVTVHLKEFPAPQYMMMNTKVKPLDDVRVRRAIQHAWNRAAWKASLGGVVGEQLAPAPLELLGEDYKPVTFDYDLAKAKQLLAEAGFPNGGFKITHYYLEGDTHKKSMGELLQAELRTLGIQMDIRSLIVARMFEMVRDFGKTRNPASAIDMITIFTPARIFDPHNYLDWHFNSKAWEYGRNFMYYENPEVDRLLAQAAATLDDAQARPLYRQMSDLVMKDAPTIMIERLVGKMYTRQEHRRVLLQPQDVPGHRGVLRHPQEVRRPRRPLLTYVTRRLALLVFVPGRGASLLTFTLGKMVPRIRNARAALGFDATPDMVRQYRREMGLDKSAVGPLRRVPPQRPARRSRGLDDDAATGPRTICGTSCPPTVELTLVSLVISVVAGAWLGIIGATRRGGVADLMSTVVPLTQLSAPVFVFGLLLLLIFYRHSAGCPMAGASERVSPGQPRSPGCTSSTACCAVTSRPSGAARSISSFPRATLCNLTLAEMTRITRSAFLQVLGEDYVRTAAARVSPSAPSSGGMRFGTPPPPSSRWSGSVSGSCSAAPS